MYDGWKRTGSARCSGRLTEISRFCADRTAVRGREQTHEA